MSLFSSILKPVGKLFGVSEPDLGGASQDAFDREMARLKAKDKVDREEARFLNVEGKGISEEADVVFGDELDLEDLTEAERELRSSGRVIQDTGLIL